MMDHKAFVFDYESFRRELCPLLADALATGECADLRRFIAMNTASLRDPYEGEPLDEHWESLIEVKNAQQYGDFALTKYYNPTADIGLGADWDTVQRLVAANATVTMSPILGVPVGPKGHLFDPGKMGSYFQSAEQVHGSYEYLRRLAGRATTEEVAHAIIMLEKAVNAHSGLYVTF